MTRAATWGEHFLRPGRSGPAEVRLDLCWLVGLALLAIATGIGLRDAWPADEPRFALIARDMVATGEWLIPRVGGNVYADKPPLFFWIVAFFLLLTDSLRVALLVPGLLAGLGSMLLVYDLARRLWDRTIGFAAALALLGSVQFVWQARQGQIDATLCFFTTLSLYGLLRHLLLGPAWRWWVIGWAAAGLGVITKGVGFLPLLVLLPYALARASGAKTAQLRLASPVEGRFWLGPLALLAAVSVWLAPMLIAAGGNPALASYRDEVLFGQTIERYAAARHHLEPFWYFIVQVIPVVWLPLIALLPWLWPRWRASSRARDLRVLLPLAWVVLVLVFFSLSSGKRGVYILPALPAFVLACAPFLVELAQRRGPRNTVFGIACSLIAVTFVATVYAFIDSEERRQLIRSYGVDVVGPLLAISVTGAVACLAARPRRGFVAYGGVALCVLLVVSFWTNPVMNDVRSGARFARQVESVTPAGMELGVVAYKEQYLLQLRRPIVNFGHARWRELDQEAADAAAWMAADAEHRVVLVDERARALCFSMATTREVAIANRLEWFLVSDSAAPACIARGRLAAARRYSPPASRANATVTEY